MQDLSHIPELKDLFDEAENNVKKFEDFIILVSNMEQVEEFMNNTPDIRSDDNIRDYIFHKHLIDNPAKYKDVQNQIHVKALELHKQLRDILGLEPECRIRVFDKKPEGCKYNGIQIIRRPHIVIKAINM